MEGSRLRIFRSPLREGQTVITLDGYTVKILSLCRSNLLPEYLVYVKILRTPFCKDPNIECIWAHKAPNRFGTSIICSINGSEPFPTLREEFFNRIKTYKKPPTY